MVRRIVFLLVLLGAALVQAQDAPAWRLAAVEDLLPTLQGYAEVNSSLTLSPDGTQLAWGAPDGLCLYALDSQQGECTPLPESFRGGFQEYNPLRWSPDGAYIAFTEDPFRLMNESDVWVYKLASGEFTNLTDDGLEGGWLRSDDAPVALDYAVSWNPANGDLYFFRSEQLAGGWTIDLYRTYPGDDEPEQVSSFTLNFPTLSVYFPPAIASDGRMMALIVLGQKREDRKNGVWTIDLEDGAAEMVVNLPDLSGPGFPDWQDREQMIPREVAWAGNDALLVYLFNGAYVTGVSWGAQLIDLTTGQVMPLVDLSAVPEPAALFQQGDDERTPQHNMVRSVMVAPDGESVVYSHYDEYTRDQPSLSALALPPVGDPVEIGTAPGCVVQSVRGTPSWLGSIASNGRVVLHNCLLTFEPG
ncbi:MAG: hypothetical protein HZC41_12775 [Chloroflexi bacterium]|nr:hypothetical protein [Chloroflexota bacterium]